jgi:hypothetical protein
MTRIVLKWIRGELRQIRRDCECKSEKRGCLGSIQAITIVLGDMAEMSGGGHPAEFIEDLAPRGNKPARVRGGSFDGMPDP